MKFASEGCRVIATDINWDKLSELDAVDGITTRKLDVRNQAEIEALAEEFGHQLDVLFYCVGYCHQGSIFDCDEKEWDSSFDLNVKSMYRTCRAFVPRMRDRGKGGAIINMSSVASSKRGLPNRFAYGATKAAVIGMTKALAVDLVGFGIRVNAVLPGTVDTESWRERVSAHPDPEKAKADFIARQKMGRLGTPEEIANIVTYLASDEVSTFRLGL